MSQVTERYQVVKARIVQINKVFYQKYGGPDISANDPGISDEDKALLVERDNLGLEAWKLQSQMTDEEFEATL